MAACPANGVKAKYERLSSDVKPAHYALTLNPCLKTFALKGSVAIDVDVRAAVSAIKLHAGSQIKITKAELKTADGNVLSGCKVEAGADDMVNIGLPSAVKPAKATLLLDFEGKLGDHMKGFYRSTYKGEDGKEKILASTQFESTFARMAFPCFDEPAMKATFDVQLNVDKTLTALSNMPVASEAPLGDELKAVKFARTPIMSTYLLAFAVGELEYIETKTKGGVTVRVYTVAGKKEQGRFALDLGAKALDWYGEFFAIPYALPKCDMIAVPDFHMGAMENWGLVTFREVVLLYNAEKTSNRAKEACALTTAHELAHLWFGDLVTMIWWTDLWLKEGFASFMEYLFVGKNYEEMKIWMRFARDEITRGMHLDSLRSSHPIEVPIDNPNELDEIYDSITYSKSNCVNRMLYEFLGEDTFKEGLRIYLKRHAYSNACTEDLWNAIAEASGQDIRSMMSGWTQQMGFPVVSVSQESAEGKTRVLRLTQERFIADGSKDELGSKWMVPITCILGPDARDGKKMLLKEKEGTLTVETGQADYVKLNARTGGFYRVHYSEPLFESIVKAFHTLPPLDRFGFATDCFALMAAGKYSTSQFLALVAACSEEQECAVWVALDDGLSQLGNVLAQADPALRKRLDAFVIKTLSPLMGKLGWEPAPGEDSQRSQLRSVVINRLARSGHEETIQAALSLFDAKKADINSDLRLAVFGTVARSGTEEQHKQLREMYEKNGFPEVERACIIAMAQTRCPKLLEQYFTYAFKEKKVRSQDLIFLTMGAASTLEGQQFAWNFFKTEQAVLQALFPGIQDSLYQGVFKSSADHFCTEAAAKEVEEFFCNCNAFTKENVVTLDRPIRQVAENIRCNARLLADSAKAVDVFLAAKGH